MKFCILIIALSSIVACSNSRDINPQNNPDSNNKFQTQGINCESGYKSINAESATAIMKDTTDVGVRSVTLMSSSKHGYDNSAYNLYESCFSRKSESCTTTDQMMFNHGGDAKNLSVDGHFILLDTDSQAKYDQIDFAKLDELSLKTVDGTAVSKDSIFGNPSTDRKMALGESSIYRDYTHGTSFLVLLDDTWSNDEYALFKMKVDEVVPGEKVTLIYQRIAEAPKDDLKNYFCSRKAAIEAAKKDSGSVTVYGRSYGGYSSSTFGFDFGVNGFDGHFVKSERVMSFSTARKCSHDQSKMCVQPYVGWVVSYWSGVIESAESLEDINKASWPELQSIDPDSASKDLEENKTYLISQLNNDTYTFGAVHISEIDPDGGWVKLDWKKVAIEEPYRFAQYTQVPITPNEANGQVDPG